MLSKESMFFIKHQNEGLKLKKVKSIKGLEKEIYVGSIFGIQYFIIHY